MICINCGRSINGKICDCCGTDYRTEEEKKEFECNHIFDFYKRMYDCKRMCQIFYLKCELCNEITSINVSDRFLYDLHNDIYDNGIIMR